MIRHLRSHLRGYLRRGPASLLALLALLVAQGYLSYSSYRDSFRSSVGLARFEPHHELPSLSGSSANPRRAGHGTLAQSTGNEASNETGIASNGRDGYSARREEGLRRTAKSSIAPEPTHTYDFPRWGDEGIRVPAMVEFVTESLQSRKTDTFSNILYVWGDDETRPGGSGGVWVSEALRSRTVRPQIRYRAVPVEDALKRAWAFLIDRPNRELAMARWPNLVRTFKVHPNESGVDDDDDNYTRPVGVPLVLFYGDFRGCNQDNHRKNRSVPLLTTCARITCRYGFPFPNYRTIRDSLPVATDWDAVFEQQRSEHPWERKVPKLVWRGGLTGALHNFTSPRSRLGRFALRQKDHPLLDIGIHQIPSRHFHGTTKKTIPSDLETRILMKPPMPAENFSNYRAILDTDGNSWSSRFGRLLCANSVVLKVEPQFIDYFYRYLTPWVHYVPVRRDLSDLLERVEWAVDPSHDDQVRRIVAEANAWCRRHMTIDAVVHDMLDVLDAYVSYLDRGDANWTSAWRQEQPTTDLECDLVLVVANPCVERSLLTRIGMMNPTAAAAYASIPSRPTRSLALWFVFCVLALGRQLSLDSQRGRERPAPSWIGAPPTAGSRMVAPPPTGILTIGVVVAVTDCGAAFPIDGAVVLKHSILRLPSERYQYQFYAVYHPEAASCVPPLADAGYVLLERDTPINVSEIKGDYLRRNIYQEVCCGEKELVKFEAFLLTQHPAVILFDADMLVVRPLDDLIDLILYTKSRPELAKRHVEFGTPNGAKAVKDDVWLLYVNDYFTATPPYRVAPTQGGFAVLKPNRTIYSDLMQIVLEGDFDPELGWGKATGTFVGGMAVQGLLTYYFQVVHPGFGLPLDFCIHDHIHFPTTVNVRRGNETFDRCVAPNCRDCENTAFEDTFSIHFTLWGKPWHCERYDWMPRYRQLALGAWFQYRSELEKSWGRSGRGGSNGTTHEALLGYCSKYGEGGYEAIRQPYGVPA